jgi:hypothetical protein
VVYDPDSTSRTGVVRLIGYSPSAGFVVTVIIAGRARAGVPAWQSGGAGLRDYDGQDRR